MSSFRSSFERWQEQALTCSACRAIPTTDMVSSACGTALTPGRLRTTCMPSTQQRWADCPGRGIFISTTGWRRSSHHTILTYHVMYSRMSEQRMKKIDELDCYKSIA